MAASGGDGPGAAGGPAVLGAEGVRGHREGLALAFCLGCVGSRECGTKGVPSCLARSFAARYRAKRASLLAWLRSPRRLPLGISGPSRAGRCVSRETATKLDLSQIGQRRAMI